MRRVHCRQLGESGHSNSPPRTTRDCQTSALQSQLHRTHRAGGRSRPSSEVFPKRLPVGAAAAGGFRWRGIESFQALEWFTQRRGGRSETRRGVARKPMRSNSIGTGKRVCRTFSLCVSSFSSASLREQFQAHSLQTPLHHPLCGRSPSPFVLRKNGEDLVA